MGFFTRGNKRLERIAEAPALMSYWDIRAWQPALPKFLTIDRLLVPDELVFTRVQNALTGRELVREKGGGYVLRQINETPEQKQRRENITKQAELALERMLELGNQLKEKQSAYSGRWDDYLTQLTQFEDERTFGIKSSTSQAFNQQDSKLSQQLKKLRDYTEQRLKESFSEEEERVLERGGADNSLGRYNLARLAAEKSKALADNEVYWLTKGRENLLNLEQKEIETEFLPLQKEMGVLKTGLEAYRQDVEKQNDEMATLFNVGITGASQEATERRNKFAQELSEREARLNREDSRKEWEYMMNADWQKFSLDLSEANRRWTADYNANRVLGNNQIREREDYLNQSGLSKMWNSFIGNVGAGVGHGIGVQFGGALNKGINSIGSRVKSWF